MDRIARLVIAAGTLRRKIWASLPWRVRVAEFMARMAVSQTDAFGQAFYEIFAKHDVTGVPNPRGSEAKQFGLKMYRVLMSKFHNAQLVEDVLSSFFARFVESGARNLRPGSTLVDAENYVLRGLTNEGINHLRKKKHEVSENVETLDEGRDAVSIFDRPRREVDHREISREVSQHVRRLLPRLRTTLNRIHPSAAQYVELSLIDGYTDIEIFGNPDAGIPSMLEHPYNTQGRPLTFKLWGMTYKPKIYAVLRDTFEDLAEAV